ncbi:hypothetical protein A3F65_02695 [Candidatus Saccharibacteria bacterium RIFCSPHIGHO2_12_FULL_47_16b]|nr:MAG: hypothetical protein A3F65_02695 [Candidatus Saccharibacteria bacterium RIFCSPHIGHO2_12_FULL_47_16b]OGL38685.1 MAG: hypothetical protein A3J32_00715 [Candidatus Saccharibacteria bacterium RIFCSPLOWO2_02_FULL_46_7]
MAETLDIEIGDLAQPIRTALVEYFDFTGEQISFNTQRATQMEPTDGKKPYTAVSWSPITYRGRLIEDLKLALVAFQPGDGTGNEESGYTLNDIIVDPPYPKEAKIVPRKKPYDREVHLPILSFGLDTPPQVFAGELELLGLMDHRLTRIGMLGQPIADERLKPVATYTVGYRDDINTPDALERFADPHAVYNASRVLVVAGFIAVNGKINNQYPDLLSCLNPRYPDTVRQVVAA